MKTSEFSFHLRKNFIAQRPAHPRDHSRLLVVDRASQTLKHDYFYNLPLYLGSQDVLVLNNSRVVPFRLFGKRLRGNLHAKVELLLLEEVKKGIWEALANPAKKLVKDDVLVFGRKNPLRFTMVTRKDEKVVLKTHLAKATIFSRLQKLGTMPTPPYIEEKLHSKNEYQTMYAKPEGSAAAPTAGLHFTPRTFRDLSKKGVDVFETTLHVGLGTFRPIMETRIEKHKIHSEKIFLDPRTAKALNQAKQDDKRIIACGTTSLRTLESLASSRGHIRPTKKQGEYTNIYITPGYAFKFTEGLITNFHLPQSTLFVLVCAFAGTKLMKHAYSEAMRRNYRFFSFGDAMLII
jgi:S-adenosylmethionine:tRNA ribosyltransferase-isomerase